MGMPRDGKGGGVEKETERMRTGERETHTHRQTHRDRHIQIERQTDRQTDRHIQRQRYRERDRQTETHRDRHIQRERERQIQFKTFLVEPLRGEKWRQETVALSDLSIHYCRRSGSLLV